MTTYVTRDAPGRAPKLVAELMPSVLGVSLQIELPCLFSMLYNLKVLQDYEKRE